MTDVIARLDALAKTNEAGRYHDATGIPARYKPFRLTDFPVMWAVAGLEFLETEAASLLILGRVGVGKTALAAAILDAWRWAVPPAGTFWPSAFLPMYTAAAGFRDLDRTQENIEEWSSVPMLVIDDIGSNRTTPHVTEQLLFLIEHRYDWCLKTVVTTNLTLAEIAEVVDPRAASRFQEGLVVDLGTKDRRGA